MSQTTSPSTTLSAALDDLAWAIARDGIEQHESAVARVVLALRSAGAVTLLLDLVADRDQPAVARERAWATARRATSMRRSSSGNPLAVMIEAIVDDRWT